MSWAFHLYEADNSTFVDELEPEVHGLGVDEGLPAMQKVGHGAGPCSFSLPIDAPLVPAKRQIVRVQLNGADWGAWRITRVRPTVVSPNGHDREVIEVSGRELYGDFGQAIVQRGLDVGHRPNWKDRTLGWPGLDYDEATAAWEDATAIAVQGWASTFYTGLPAGLLDGTSLWISDGAGDDTDAPDDTLRWCRDHFTLSDYVANLVIDFAVDNSGQAWLDGHYIGEHDSFAEPRRIECGPASAGTHVFACTIVNAPDDGPPGGNPTAAIFTYRNGIYGPVLGHSDTSTQILPYNQPKPGMTDGEIALLLTGENPNLDYLSPTFTRTEATNGTDWPILDPLSADIGARLDSWHDGRTEVAVDWEIEPDGTFNMWVKGERGTTSSLDLTPYLSTAGQADPASVNLNELEWDDDDEDSFDALLVLCTEGYLIRPSSPPAGARYGFLEVDGDVTYAASVADAQLAANGGGVQTATIDLVPLSTAEWPGAAFDVWDILNVPTAADPDVTEGQRVRAIEFSLDSDGNEHFGVQLGSLVQERAELIDRQLRARGADGTAGGQSAAAKAVAAQVSATAPPRVSTVIFGSEPYPATGASGAFHFPFACRVLWVRVTATGPSGTTTLQIRRANGATVVATLSMGSGATSDVEEGLDVVTNTAEAWDWNVTAVGGHTQLVITAGVAPR